MKAPDKIYVREYQDGDYTTWWDEKPHEEESIGMKAVCYIRKDALIEWVKEHKCVIETHGDERDAYLRGEYSILNSLIDKLNSM